MKTNLIQIVVPILSYSDFFPKSEFYFPKPLIEVCGEMIIKRVIQNLKKCFPKIHFIFICEKEVVREFSLDRILKLLTDSTTTIITKEGNTSGALSSCLLAIDHLIPDKPLIICNSDQVIDVNLYEIVEDFINKNADIGVISFKSSHPRWSYIQTDSDETVTFAAEKSVISRDAIAGFVFYKTSDLFVDLAKKVLLANDNFRGNFYISSTLNQSILQNGRIIHKNISKNSYHSFYSPAKIKEYESNYTRTVEEAYSVEQRLNIIVPAAGRGSRFFDMGWNTPKPFIDISGSLMIERVIDNIKSFDCDVTLILQESDIQKYPAALSKLYKYNIISLDGITEGTACTILKSYDVINCQRPLLIANSDQLVDININLFIEDAIKRDLDGSILVFKNKKMDPKWSYVEIDEDGNVIRVAEKNPISDLATVGLYFFKSGQIYIRAAIEMIISNDRVNNEFYTCPVYNYAIEKGLNIGIYELRETEMHGLGTPNDLMNYMNTHGLSSVDMP